jgi:hypothetical protein
MSVWTTGNEKDYIDGILSGANLRNCPHQCALSNAEMLKNYIKSAQLRRKHNTFGSVSATEVIAHAERLLEKE